MKFSIVLALAIIVSLSMLMVCLKPSLAMEDRRSITITATRSESYLMDVPSSVEVFDSKKIASEIMAKTTPDILKNTPGVMIQKTAYGQGSPYIRGFTGYQTLFLIDGIKLNNSVFRSGPNQYWSSVDSYAIDRLEIVKGAGSVLYGSDAIGGTVNALMKGPTTARGNGQALARHESADNAKIARTEFAYTGPSFGVFLGGSAKDLNDLRAGEGTGRQPKSGHNEWDIDAKTEYAIANNHTLIAAFQNTQQNSVDRTHKTTAAKSWQGTIIGTDKEYSTDQLRRLAYLQYQKKSSDDHAIKLSLSYHTQKEDQFRVTNSSAQEIQSTHVHTLGAFSQFDYKMNLGKIVYGLEYYRDSVNTSKNNYSANGTFISSAIQGPVANNSHYYSAATYLQAEATFAQKIIIIPGLRYNYNKVNAGTYEDTLTGRASSFKKSYNAVVASTKGVYKLGNDDNYSLFASVAQGFRAPNLSDLTRFDEARSGEIEIPSTDLKAEKYLCYETGLKTNFEKFSSELSAYYTQIDGMIIRTPNGVTSSNNKYQVTKKNSGDGYIYGFEAGFHYEFIPSWSLSSSYTWLQGRIDAYPTSASQKSREPITRMMPPTGYAEIKWTHPEHVYWVALSSHFASKQSKLSSADKLDTQRIPPGGSKGYVLVNLRSGLTIWRQLRGSIALENIFNKNYRVHGSGINGPGFNLITGIDWFF
ncbi:MAG: TonB-dependent receptor [Oligoflexia bacterium]|nr:TonB-dependent receptor [Oligoflexia bacterium]